MLKYVTDIKNCLYVKEEKIEKKKIKDNLDNKVIININRTICKYLGMGSALTESSAYNYSLLTEENRMQFLKDCYSEKGLNYQYGRISIGSCDFSLKFLSYAKKKNLSDFSIEKDKEYLIPFLKDILNIKNISLIASPWSPPRMYKRIKTYRFGTKLSKKYYDQYSNYLIKYLTFYQREGINIPYITMQNEPFARQKWESCKYTLEEQKEFIYDNLLPKLKDTKLLLFDHNKDNLYQNIKFLYHKNSKIAGVAFHNYSGRHFDELKKIRNDYSKLLLINTEGCTGFSEYNELLWIKDAEYYLYDIIGDFNNGTNAYLDWNILLNREGGPSHIKNPVKSILILDKDNYIKTSIYYYVYHISHFASENMEIIKYDSDIKDLDILILKNEYKLIIVVMNRKDNAYKYNIVINNEYISDFIDAHCIITYINNFDKKTSNNEKNII